MISIRRGGRPVADPGSKKRRAGAALGAVLVLMITACGGGASTPTQGAGTPVKVSFRTDFLPSGTQAGFYLALEKGYYRGAGLDVSIGDGRGSGVTAQAVGAGSDDFGFAATSAVVAAIAQGIPLKSVAMITNKGSYGAFIDKKLGVTKLDGLYGKKILIVAGSPDSFLTKAVFVKNKLDGTKYTEQAVDASAKVTSYVQGLGDAMVTTIPYGNFSVQKGRPSDVIAFSDNNLAVLDFGIITNQTMLDTHADVVKKFVEASLKGWQDAQSDPAAAAKALVKNRPDVPLDLATDQITLQVKFLFSDRTKGKPIGCASADDWKDSLALLRDNGGVKGADPAQAAKYFTNQYVPGCS